MIWCHVPVCLTHVKHSLPVSPACVKCVLSKLNEMRVSMETSPQNIACLSCFNAHKTLFSKQQPQSHSKADGNLLMFEFTDSVTGKHYIRCLQTTKTDCVLQDKFTLNLTEYTRTHAHTHCFQMDSLSCQKPHLCIWNQAGKGCRADTKMWYSIYIYMCVQ